MSIIRSNHHNQNAKPLAPNYVPELEYVTQSPSLDFLRLLIAVCSIRSLHASHLLTYSRDTPLAPRKMESGSARAWRLGWSVGIVTKFREETGLLWLLVLVIESDVLKSFLSCGRLPLESSLVHSGSWKSGYSCRVETLAGHLTWWYDW